MRRRLGIVLCLVFSGLTALVYQIVWTRLLGLAFGATTEAIASVLAVFFGGLALGNLAAARGLARLRRPLRAYALLELGIGSFALASLPLLRGGLDGLFAALGADWGAPARAALRVAAAAAILLPPTTAMGATLPLVARALVREDATRGRSSAVLYGANTLGAVLGAYLCGFWMLPALGLTRSLIAAAAVNLALALAALALARGVPETPACAGASRARVAEGGAPGPRRAFLVFFALSGFVAIGYEVIWSKVFGIVMEGTLYGFASVLSAYLLGVGLGSLAIAPRVDRIRDLPRAFGLLHVGIAAAVAVGTGAVPYLPFAYQRLASLFGAGDAVHLLFLLVLPIVLLPTALFGAAFPVLIRIYTTGASGVASGLGVATAVNTAGSIAASLLVGFWWIPALGTDATLYLLLLLDVAGALVVLGHFQLAPGVQRLRVLAGSGAAVLLILLSFNGVQIERAVAGRNLRARDLAGYERELAGATASQALQIEGRSSVVTVYALPDSRVLRTNGLPEAGFRYGPPHYPFETVALGLLPYFAAESPRRALVIGLGGGNTLKALQRTRLEAIEVIEIERAVVDAMQVLYRGRQSPLEDPRVALHVEDARHELLLRRHRNAPGFDLIASQPSHPWRVGAANLFTEEFFRLVHANLSEGGVFSLWVNGFRMDPVSLLAVVASFERSFPGALLLEIGSPPRRAFLLLGGRRPLELDLETLARRMAEPEVASLLAHYDVRGPADLLARSEGPAAAFAAVAPVTANTDDNAFVETRIPRRLVWDVLDFSAIEARLPADAPVLPALRGRPDVAAIARALLRHAEGPGWPFAAKLERLLRGHGGELAPAERETLRLAAGLREPGREAEALAALRELAAAYPSQPEPLRVLGTHLAEAPGAQREAAAAFAEAFARSGRGSDAYAAGRSLDPEDPAAAWGWFQRIPPAERGGLPGLALYEARRALRQGLRGEALAAPYAALRRYRDTEEGREAPAVNEVLSQLAYAQGDVVAARGYADADRDQRLLRGDAWLARARAALAAGRGDEALPFLTQAAEWLPASEAVIVTRARAALDRDDGAAFERALEDLRRWAPTESVGIAAENRFRALQGLPLLPE